ncbi:MAG: NUDIX hydrolase [Parcubacteria group bacterium]|jgi:ADP-ribose pyrophosphatase YjhB (NUDIX family)
MGLVLRVAAPLIIRRNGIAEILLVKEGYMKEWKTPGGNLERGENWREAARREAREEVGLGIEILPYFGHYFLDRPKADVTIHVVSFLARIRSGKLTPHAGMRDLNWFNLNNLPSGDLAPNILPGLHYFGLL